MQGDLASALAQCTCTSQLNTCIMKIKMLLSREGTYFTTVKQIADESTVISCGCWLQKRNLFLTKERATYMRRYNENVVWFTRLLKGTAVQTI